eukprot:7144462-Alexandrium_andersonii.AAC.1
MATSCVAISWFAAMTDVALGAEAASQSFCQTLRLRRCRGRTRRASRTGRSALHAVLRGGAHAISHRMLLRWRAVGLTPHR